MIGVSDIERLTIDLPDDLSIDLPHNLPTYPVDLRQRTLQPYNLPNYPVYSRQNTLQYYPQTYMRFPPETSSTVDTFPGTEHSLAL
jgi:hypothetical protein